MQLSVTARALYSHKEGRTGNVKQVGFEPRPEDSCGSDKIKQTVPDTSSGDRKSSVTDGRQSGACDLSLYREYPLVPLTFESFTNSTPTSSFLNLSYILNGSLS